MRIFLFLFLCTLSVVPLMAQKKTYADSLRDFREDYVTKHEVVKGEDKSFLRFFPVNKSFRINCTVEASPDTGWFKMATSSRFYNPLYRVYGVARFKIGDSVLRLRIYQSKDLMRTEKYKDYLFIPFTDLTSADGSYGGGRYIDLLRTDIKNANSLVIDFNKAYNPYCAYGKGFSCPLPPKENDLPVAIRAGEMDFAKPH